MLQTDRQTDDSIMPSAGVTERSSSIRSAKTCAWSFASSCFNFIVTKYQKDACVLSVMTPGVWSWSLNGVRPGNKGHVVGSEIANAKLK